MCIRDRSRSVYAGASGLTVVDAPESRRSYRTTWRPPPASASQSASGQESMVVPPASRTSGAAAAPLVLLAGGTTMLSWPDALCEALAGGGRHVVRYDLRDSGASTTVNPEAPAYTLRDLAADAAA